MTKGRAHLPGPSPFNGRALPRNLRTSTKLPPAGRSPALDGLAVDLTAVALGERVYELDPAQVEAAVGKELAVLGPKDDAWRAEAAERAEEALSEAEKLWGAKPPNLYSGASA